MGTAEAMLTEPPEELRFRRRLTYSAALRDLWHFRELVVTLAERELRARYKQAILGFAWAVLTPLIYMVVFTVFFQRVADIDTGDAPYALFSYVALVPWTFFSNSISLGGTSLIQNIPLLNKVYCPREVFPLASTCVAAIDAAVSLLILGLLFIVYRYPPALTSIWVPLLFAVQLAFTLGLALIMSSVLVYVRDLRHMIPILLQLGLFATPVAYGIEEIPASFRWLYALLNPLAPVIDGYRETVLFGRPPDWTLLGLGAITATITLVGGYMLFKRLESGFADVA